MYYDVFCFQIVGPIDVGQAHVFVRTVLAQPLPPSFCGKGASRKVHAIDFMLLNVLLCNSV